MPSGRARARAAGLYDLDVEQLNSNLAFVLAIGGLAGALVLALACAGHRTAAKILFFLVVASFDVTFRNRGYGDKGLDLQVLAKLLLWGAAGLFALSRANRLLSALSEPAAAAWLLLLGWFAASSVYAPNPIFSSVAVASLCAVFLFFLTIVREIDDSWLGSLALLAAGTVCAISLVGYFVSPDTMRLWSWIDGSLVRTSRIVGITGHANAIGGIGAFGILIARIFWSVMDSRGAWLHVAAVACCLAALLLSQSRTPIGGLLVVLGCYQLMYFRKGTRPMVVLGVLTSVAFGLIILFTYDAETTISLLTRSGDLQEILTVTGRTAIWGAVLDLWSESPILGWGYGSSTYIIPKISASIGFVVAQSHNLIIQVMLSGGVVALTIFTAAAVISLRAVLRTHDAASATLLGFVFIGGLTEGAVFNNTPDLSFATLSLGVALLVRRSQAVRLAEEPEMAVSLPPVRAR